MNELNEQILDAWIQLTTAINNERIVSEMPLNEAQIFIALNEDKMLLYREQHEHILSIVNKLVDRIGEENANQALKLFNLIAQIAGEEIV